MELIIDDALHDEAFTKSQLYGVWRASRLVNMWRCWRTVHPERT